MAAAIVQMPAASASVPRSGTMPLGVTNDRRLGDPSGLNQKSIRKENIE
jgi:hypothetical protein